MIDINKLRRLVQAATPGPDGVSLNWVKLLQDFQKEANPAVINELLDRLEESEADAIEQALLLGMGSEREAALMAKLEAAEKERDTLLARIEAMEKQEPGDILYLAPGAQPAPSIPERWKLVPIEPTPSVPDAYWKQAVEEISDEGFGAVFKRLISDRAAMLAAAPESKT